MTPSPYLTGQLLLAMPGMVDPRFHKSVIFLCLHDEKGAMGLVLNNPLPGLAFGPLMEQLDILPESSMRPDLRGAAVFNGGPVEQTRGFLLHDETYHGADTIAIGDHFSVTGTTDGLKEVGGSSEPLQTRFILGYAGWDAEQLDRELQDNAWLTLPPTHDLVFGTPPALQWAKAYAALGIDPAVLSTNAGRA